MDYRDDNITPKITSYPSSGVGINCPLHSLSLSCSHVFFRKSSHVVWTIMDQKVRLVESFVYFAGYKLAAKTL